MYKLPCIIWRRKTFGYIHQMNLLKGAFIMGYSTYGRLTITLEDLIGK